MITRRTEQRRGEACLSLNGAELWATAKQCGDKDRVGGIDEAENQVSRPLLSQEREERKQGHFIKKLYSSFK